MYQYNDRLTQLGHSTNTYDLINTQRDGPKRVYMKKVMHRVKTTMKMILVAVTTIF
jgi:hypothetical protein